jgi:hypothetical protein
LERDSRAAEENGRFVAAVESERRYQKTRLYGVKGCDAPNMTPLDLKATGEAPPARKQQQQQHHHQRQRERADEQAEAGRESGAASSLTTSRLASSRSFSFS